MAQEDLGKPPMPMAGRYQLIEYLGGGGFGEVWKALDTRLNVEVAIKRVKLPGDAGADDVAKAVGRAEAEARNAAALQYHPNIVAVQDVVTGPDGMPWLIMRLIRGQSLHAALRSRQAAGLGPLPEDEVAKIAAGVLAALGAAHAKGIVHRDVKPANILLDDDGGVFLADFGISRHDADPGLTTTGKVLVSYGYTAPERFDAGHPQANGPAGDLFSLGAMLYEAVEGRPPFMTGPDDSIIQIIHAVGFKPHPPMVRAARLAPLIDALLAKQPEERPSVDGALALLRGIPGMNSDQPSATRPYTDAVRITDIAPPTSFDVVLTDAGAKKIQVMKTLVELTQIGLKAAKDLVDRSPSVVLSGVDEATATSVAAALGRDGATAAVLSGTAAAAPNRNPNLAAPEPAQKVQFSVVRRGYDPVQVDRYLAQPPQQRGPLPRFEVLRRGYDPAEVDRYLSRMATQDVVPPGPELATPPTFSLVRRGYDPVQVDRYLAQPPHRRVPEPRFDQIRRGYDCAEVDRYVSFSRFADEGGELA